jgi:UDP-2,4-diacetamido-2,4,6-trideoxy-beta-L-altropyranose hydrolase
MADNSPILLRADASVQMGTGHVMRCLGLAQQWQDSGGEAVYAMAESAPGVEERLQAEHIEVVSLTCEPASLQDARATVDAARSRGCDWIVLDGYHFNADYHAAIKASGLRLLALDDLGSRACYIADIVLNQDPIADERMYVKRTADTRLLLGTHYAVLRRDFRQRPRPQREFVPVVRKLLITMGGSDPQNFTEEVIRCLDGTAADDLEVFVLVGPSNPHGPQLEAAARDCRANVRLLRNPANIPDLMAECDMAVTAGGSTLWELSYFAVPCIVVVIAENQRAVAEYLKAQRACLVLDDAACQESVALQGVGQLLDDRELRIEYGTRFAAMIDGRGAVRVCEAMRGIGQSP